MPPVKKYNHNEELEVNNKRLKETAEIIEDRLEDEKEKSRRMEETLRNKLFDRTLKIQGLQKESKLLKKKLKLQNNNNHRMFKSLKELWKLIETMRREK